MTPTLCTKNAGLKTRKPLVYQGFLRILGCYTKGPKKGNFVTPYLSLFFTIVLMLFRPKTAQNYLIFIDKIAAFGCKNLSQALVFSLRIFKIAACFQAVFATKRAFFVFKKRRNCQKFLHKYGCFSLGKQQKSIAT